MDIEFEAKIIKIDKEDIRTKLKQIGAELVFAEKMFTRVTYDSSELKSNGAWIRLRDEGGKITLALKQVSNEKSVEGTKEISFNVSDFNQADKFIQGIGFTKNNYQQNYREEWKTKDAVFDIDTWPMIDPWLEIEAQNEEMVRKYIQVLGFDFSKAMFGSADIVYRDVYGIDILSKHELSF